MSVDFKAPQIKQKIKGLDGLRGLSVLLVIFSHAEIWPKIGLENSRVLAVLSAHVGVSVFFALSGFLITLLLLQERSSTGSVSLRNFFFRRTLRIFPLYYLSLIILCLIDFLAYANIPNCAFLYAFTYTQNFAPPTCSFSSMSHFWSLAVEEHFYLIWPTVFLLGTRVAFGFSGLFSIACLTVGPIVTGAMTGVDVWRWTFPAAAPIAFGCVAAIVVENPVAARLFLNEKVASSALLFSLVGLLSPAFLTTDTLWLVSISVLIVFVYYKQNSLFVNFLEFRPLAYLGLISYGLYVWQGVFTGNGSYRVGESFPPGLDLGVWLTFLVAPISYVFFEQPILKLKRQYSWRQHEG